LRTQHRSNGDRATGVRAQLQNSRRPTCRQPLRARGYTLVYSRSAMRVNAFAAAFAVISLFALTHGQEGPAKFLLPSPVQLRGVVVDVAGDPVADVRINHLFLTEAFALTDRAGRFEFDARGPAVVFRKRGWKSQLVRVSAVNGTTHVVLDRASDPDPLPTCSPKPHCVTLAQGEFCLPVTSGMQVSRKPFSIDTLEQEFAIHSGLGPDKKMLHGSGLAWGGPEPLTSEIWDSIEFSEIQRDAQGSLVLDARGKTTDGKLWRSIGQSGESVYYYGQDPKDASLFDRVLDGLCVLVANR
jgi:hypothetical protein